MMATEWVASVLPAAMLACWAAISGCGGGESPTPAAGTQAKVRLTSGAFEPGQAIPVKYTEDGQDVSPPLTWSDVPAGVKAWALIVDDPDAPRKDPWVHWVVYNLPSGQTELADGASAAKDGKKPPAGAEGTNSWNVVGYRGPAPPPGHGVHHYHFKLYALDAALDLKAGLDKEGLLQAIQGHILAQGELIGTYKR